VSGGGARDGVVKLRARRYCYAMFRALWIERSDAGQVVSLRELDEASLVDGDVLVRVAYSTINYKDGLALTGRAPIVRRYPMIPGVDLAGVVERSDHPSWKPGDRVLLNGWGSGETRWGGLSQRARVPGELLVPLPPVFTERQAMALGSAGYTAALCVLALERHGVRAGDGEVLVTGATGGVGSVAVALLARRGHRVAASTGKLAEGDYLRSLGAADVVDRRELARPGRPLGPARWAAVVDNVGSHTLANACATTRTHGAVASVGNASGMDFPGSVAPFILRGVTLYGIDSNTAPQPLRLEAWRLLASDVDPRQLEAMTHEVALGEATRAAEEIVAGQVRGRIVVDVNR
jgi:acrylyl-CoA reductase (NADPH)